MVHEVRGRHLTDPLAFPLRDGDLIFVTAVHILRHKAVISKIDFKILIMMCKNKLHRWFKMCSEHT